MPGSRHANRGCPEISKGAADEQTALGELPAAQPAVAQQTSAYRLARALTHLVVRVNGKCDRDLRG